MNYTIEDHKHRFAAWAASRAASTKTCRFNVLQGRHIIEAVGLSTLVTPDLLPAAANIDSMHREWRNSAIAAAEARDLVGFSHGIAAKLINVYLKGLFVCGGHSLHPHVAALHPPIDKLLLDELSKENVGTLKKDWDKVRRIRWSKLTSAEYDDLIVSIRKALRGKPMWAIESYWRGHQ